MKSWLWPLLALWLFAIPLARAEEPSAIVRQVDFEQRLNEQVPLDLAFRDELGQPVALEKYFGSKPVILVLAYYRCPQLCTLVLNGLAESLRGFSLRVGVDFEVVTVSFDARETPELARAKKQSYVESIENVGQPRADQGWHFLTGDLGAIDRLTQAAGFRYKYDSKLDQFAHPSGILVLTPQGKIARYFFGLDFPQRDLRLGLVEASAGKIGSPIDQVWLRCYQYDPATGRYTPAVMNIVRLAGALTILGLAVLVLLLHRRKRDKSAPASVAPSLCLSVPLVLGDVPLFPEQASTTASRVDALFFFLLAVSGFFALLIATLVIFFAVKYRRRSEADRPKRILGSLRLEIFWSVIPLVISMVMFFWGASLYFSMARPPDDAMEIYVVGKQWMWKIQHPDGQREINELHVPVDRPVMLTMTSEDVIHDFFVPAFRIKQDVLPGRYVRQWFQATRPGKYHLFCAQYCGTNHSRMIGTVTVMEKAQYEDWLRSHAEGSPALEGRKLFLKLQCVSCHSADARARAPNLEGLYKSTVRLTDGRLVTADEDYIRESIVKPRARIVAGYEPIMPTFEGKASEEDILNLISFIKALGPGQTPPRVESAPTPDAPVQPAETEKKKP